MRTIANWTAIRDAYIEGDIGYRPLAQLYSVSFNTLKQRAKRESWADKRAEYRRTLGAEARIERAKVERRRQPEPVSDTPEDKEPTPQTAQVKKAAKVYDAADRLLNRIIRMSEEDDSLKAAEIKALTGALRDIKEIKMIEDGIAPHVLFNLEEYDSGGDDTDNS